MQLQFEWDGRKAQGNLSKHNVSFEEAQTVFLDPLACIFDDEFHSIDEVREIIIGHSSNKRLLLVCFTERVLSMSRKNSCLALALTATFDNITFSAARRPCFLCLTRYTAPMLLVLD